METSYNAYLKSLDKNVLPSVQCILSIIENKNQIKKIKTPGMFSNILCLTITHAFCNAHIC